MTIPQQNFEIVWHRLQRDISAGITIRNWTKYGGYIGGDFKIHDVSSEFVEVDAPDATNLQRINRKEFEKIYGHWDAYNKGSLPRRKLRDMTRFSKYIISILHHLMQ